MRSLRGSWTPRLLPDPSSGRVDLGVLFDSIPMMLPAYVERTDIHRVAVRFNDCACLT
jgi:hypothetical protein